MMLFSSFTASVRGRQAVTRGSGDDGGETECEYQIFTTPLWVRILPLHEKKKTFFSCTLAGEEHSAIPACIGRAAQTNPLLNHLHDLSTQASQIPAPTLWQAQRDLRGYGSWREQGKPVLHCTVCCAVLWEMVYKYFLASSVEQH